MNLNEFKKELKKRIPYAEADLLKETLQISTIVKLLIEKKIFTKEEYDKLLSEEIQPAFDEITKHTFPRN